MGGDETNSVRYGECLKPHAYLGGKLDGCQDFELADGKIGVNPYCSICGCLMKFHRKLVQTEVVYTECQKNHNLQGSYSRDGCQQFKWRVVNDPVDTCAACGCHHNFHKNVVARSE